VIRRSFIFISADSMISDDICYVTARGVYDMLFLNVFVLCELVAILRSPGDNCTLQWRDACLTGSHAMLQGCFDH